MEQPMVSVIMGVYNQWNETVLREAVNSILNQTYKNLEFIIWDDGSHPEAAKLVQSLSALDQRILVAGREKNRGLAYSLNECIRMAKGKYIARMDADDISLPDRIAKQVSFMEKNKDYAWCGCNTLLFDEKGVWGVRKMPETPDEKDYLRSSQFVHPSVMFRAMVFDEHEGYLEAEETLRCEDYEIFMRLRQKGLRGYNLQEVLFSYRENNESYEKRRFHFRVNEAKLRYRNFKKMKMLLPFGWIYCIRPIVGGLLPASIISFLKRSEGARTKKNIENKSAEAIGFEGRERIRI